MATKQKSKFSRNDGKLVGTTTDCFKTDPMSTCRG